jgi:hypothetical protein
MHTHIHTKLKFYMLFIRVSNLASRTTRTQTEGVLKNRLLRETSDSNRQVRGNGYNFKTRNFTIHTPNKIRN